MKCKIKLIVAFDEKYYIGKDNKLLWNIPEDLQLFKNKTKGKIVIMGRNTYESIGKPLKDRYNIILSNDKEFYDKIHLKETFSGNMRVFNDMNKLLEWLKDLDSNDEVFIIGGKSLYKQFLDMNLVDEMYISHIGGNYKGDIKFPKIDWKKWKVVKRKIYDKFIFKKYKKVLTN